MNKTVYIDEEECIGCQACVEVCPEVFVFNESTGLAIVHNPDGANEEAIREAQEVCPTNCILFE